MQNWRSNLVFAIIVLFILAVLSKLFFIQVINQGFYRALAEGQQKWFQEVKGDRGEIFIKDRQGNRYLLATNISKNLVYLRPGKVKNKKDLALALEEILGLKKEEVLKKMDDDSASLFLLKDDLTDEEMKKLKEKNLAGLYFLKKKVRFYPQRNLAAQVIGFLGGEGKGQYGVEGFYDELLQGKKTWLKGERNPWGFSLGEFKKKVPEGADLILTLDYNIQQKAEHLLGEGVKELEAEGGEILVLDPQKGKILALANFPSFDLNHYDEVADQAIFQNSAIQKLFEPGSVFKPVVMAGALEEGKITPETTYLDRGFVKFGPDTIYNYGHRVWGERTMTEVLEKSINTGAVFAQKQLGGDKFLEYIKRFGFFEKTGVDLQGEVWSENKELKNGRPINFATASFGQGVDVTSLQLARAFAAIANGGHLVRPYVVQEVVREGKEVLKTEPEVQKEGVILAKTANELTTMLIKVVEEGFAKAARVPGYYIAGKTGTAQVPFSSLGIDKAGYSEKTIQSFVGFFPALNPQFLVLVKLNNPKTKTAEYSAVPLFQKLAKYIIDYWEIPPDYE